MGTYEGKWRCGHCRTVNLGRFLNCQGCGSRRPDDVQFFLEGDEAEVNDAELLNRAAEGPDWACPFCKGLNPFNANTCQSCGAARAEGKVLEEEIKNAEEFREKQTPATFRVQAAEVSAVATSSAGKRGCFSPRILALIAAPFLILILLFGFLLYLFRERDARLVVDHVEWSRSIGVEEYRQKTEQDWESKIPSDAQRISSRSEVHHYDRVPTGTHTETESYTERVEDGTEEYKCGTKSKKNGFFEDVYCSRTKYKTVSKTRPKTVTDYKEVPVFQNKVTYTVWRWDEINQAVAKGTDMNPTWPAVQIGDRQREGKRKENYHLYLRDHVDNSKRYDKEVTADEFLQYPPGAICPAKVRLGGKLEGLSPPG
jgi:hypothetical protein